MPAGRPAHLVTTVTRPAHRRLFVLLTVCLGSVAVATVWHFLRPVLVAGRQYRIAAEHIHINPPPEWIQADILAEVMRDPSLTGPLSVLDESVSHRLASAFEFHPWVAGVRKVTKHYGPRVDLQLVYRKPVMMVTLGRGADALLIPCDIHGVRLPASGFTPEEKRHYPRLEGIDDEPLVGQPWNDPRVLGAARVARLLFDVWQSWGLDSIRPTMGDPSAGQTLPEIELEIKTVAGVRILWGPPPANDRNRNRWPPRKKRLASLLAQVKRAKPETVIDLRPYTDAADTIPAAEPSTGK